MRALERSWSGWGLRTIKMIHLSKIKVSRTSRMLKFELFWLKCFLCLHWTISKVYTAPILNIEMYQINVYCIKSVRVTLIFAGNTLIDDRSNVLVLTCGWLVSPAAAAWLWSVPPHPEMPRSPWLRQSIYKQNQRLTITLSLLPLPLSEYRWAVIDYSKNVYSKQLWLDLRCYIVKLRIQGCRYWV